MRSWISPVNRWLEPGFVLLIASGLIYAMWHLYYFGYLPQPFFYEPFDMWGDWFNVVYWAYDPGTYDNYGSVYPPLSFVFLRLFSLSRCYDVGAQAGDFGAGLPSRSCDWLGIATIFLIYASLIVVVSKTYLKIDHRTAPWRAYALTAGFPTLEALEHANLIIPTLLLVVLAYGPLVRSARLRWIAIGLAVNFKIYVVASIFGQLLKRRWLWTEAAFLSVVLVYLVTYIILGRGTPFEIYKNLTAFADSGASNLLDVWFPATFLALQALLQNWQSPMMGILGSRNVEFLLILLPTLQHIVQLSIVLAAVAAWIRPEAAPRFRLINLALSMALITQESGGYTVILTFFFTFMERWRGIGAKWAIIAVYILCIPADIPIDKAPEVVRTTFLPGRTVIANYSVMIGPFIRPLFFYSIPFALSCVTIYAVWRDIQTQGWKTRWRYRRDLPIMVGEGTARKPA